MPPVAAAWLAGGKGFAVAGAGLADKGAQSISPGATILPAQIDDVGASGTPAAANARLLRG